MPVQKYCGADLKESYENNTEEAHSSKLKSTVSMDKLPVVTITESNSFYSYPDYAVSSDEEKL